MEEEEDEKQKKRRKKRMRSRRRGEEEDEKHKKKKEDNLQFLRSVTVPGREYNKQNKLGKCLGHLWFAKPKKKKSMIPSHTTLVLAPMGGLG